MLDVDVIRAGNVSSQILDMLIEQIAINPMYRTIQIAHIDSIHMSLVYMQRLGSNVRDDSF